MDWDVRARLVLIECSRGQSGVVFELREQFRARETLELRSARPSLVNRVDTCQMTK